MVLAVLLLVGSIVPVGSSGLVQPPLPSEPTSLASTDALRSVPTPANVPAGLTPVTQQNHPCWPIDPNGSECIQVDVGNWSQPDVVPNPLAGQLNTSTRLYPYDDQDIHFQVLSAWNIGTCQYYNPPSTYAGSTCTGTQGPSYQYSGWQAYLFLTVVDVMWQDVCWYCTTDGTQWHANAGSDWAPTQGEPYVGKVPTDPTSTLNNWVFDLNISAYGGNGAANFPNGTWVMWNVTNNFWNGSSTLGYHRVQYCAPQCGGGLSGGMFYYVTRNAWYYDTAPPGTFPPYGPNGAYEAPDGGFPSNVNLTYYPVVPNIGDTVNVDIRTQNIDNLTGALFDSEATIIILNAWYSNGTFWRTWVSGFTPLAYPYNDTWHERVILPADFFAHSGTRVQWFVQAYDQYGHMIQSQNYTQIVSRIGTCPDGNFSACLNLTTDPSQIDTEGWNGWLNSTPPSIPGVQINQQVNVSITTVERSIDIEAAYVIIHVDYSTTGGTGTGLYSLHRITLNQYYYDVPSLPEGSNVTFVVKAVDYNGTSVLSHPYRFFVPLNIITPAQYCFFYVQVFNAATNQPINGANVTFIFNAGTRTIRTVTSLDGVAYPNVTNEQWTPTFITAGTPVTVKVQVRGFLGVGLPAPGDTITTTVTCQHEMLNTSVLAAGSNYQVVLKNDVENFTLNQAYSPPIFSAIVTPGISPGMIFGMVAASAVLVPVFLIWRRQREIAAAEEKRVTL